MPLLYYFGQFSCHASQGPKFSKFFRKVTVTARIFEHAGEVTKSAKIAQKIPFFSNLPFPGSIHLKYLVNTTIFGS
ncbi:hypothetical protein B0H12DRAFT_1123856 [Mycena haematopus]|nr:hypothetical protein B0H12DRAFT_1123856 [Mycena haematopus]